jgi:hypothetical protein
MLKILYIFFFVVVSQTTFCADITWSEKMADAILLQQYSAQKLLCKNGFIIQVY